MWRVILILSLLLAGVYYLYDNLDNPTLRVTQAALEHENFGSNTVIMLNKIGLPPHVVDKMAKQQGPNTTTIIPVEDTDFNQAMADQLAAKYGRVVVGVRVQVAIGPNYAKVELTRLGGVLKSLTVNYDSKTDSWKVA